MKTLSFNNNAGITMSFLTDCIDGNEQFSVLQIITSINGTETVGIPDSIVRLYDIPIELGKCYMLQNFIAYAEAKSFNLLLVDEESTEPTYLVDNRSPILEVLSVTTDKVEYEVDEVVTASVLVENTGSSGSGTLEWELVGVTSGVVDSGTASTGVIAKDETSTVDIEIPVLDSMMDESYIVQVRLVDGEWVESNSWSPYWTPRNVVLTAITGGFRITWTNAKVDTETEIWIKQDSGTLTLITTTAPTIATYDYLCDAGHDYTVELRAKLDQTVLSIPTGFTAVDQTGGIVRLNCDAVTDADHYVWSANIAGAGHVVISTTVNPTYDHNVGVATEVKYKVRAKEGTLPVYSSYTSEIDVTTAGSATSYANTGGTGDRTALIVMGGTSIWKVYISGSLYNLINGSKIDENLYFQGGAVVNHYVQFDFKTGARKVIDEAKWYQGGTTSNGVWQWKGSNEESATPDPAGFVNIGNTFTLGGSTTQTITALSGNTTGYRHYRLVGVSGNALDTDWLFEIEFKISA